MAVSPLIEAVSNPYLGVRIGASELLRSLDPNIISVDPWQSSAQLSNTVVALRKWWSDTGRLPPTRAAGALDPATENSIKAELDQLGGDDPTRRTEAMAALVGHGAAALPHLREAIKRAERSGDLHTLGWLEDVRWAILVPDSVEQRVGGVRTALARGKSSERQGAVERLGRAGHDGLEALTDLVNDPDPLVVESAVRALSVIGGKETVPVLAALLQAGDNNLRMTAAQALGQSKSPDAVKPLLAVFDDPNEVVACTALGALEEIRSQADGSLSRKPLPAETTAALRRCLADSRWRVRAAAAEIIGKLGALELADELKKLLDDSDSFVVKSALTALRALHSVPGPEQLSALAKRLPSLSGDVVELMLQSENEDTVKVVTDLFGSLGPGDQLAILNALARSVSAQETKSDDGWKPLLRRAATASDPRLRRGAAAVLMVKSPRLAADLVAPLLADDDREARLTAANVVLEILDKQRAGPSADRDLDSVGGPAMSTASPQEKTNAPSVPAAQIAAWHASMERRPEPNPTLQFAAARYVTGDARAGLPPLLNGLEKTATGFAAKQPDFLAIRAILSKLPWPEGRPALDKLVASPLLFAIAAHETPLAAPAVADYLLEPSRFRAAVEPASGETLSAVLGVLAGYESDDPHAWSLWTQNGSTKAVALGLLDSTNAAWRAAAVFFLGLHLDALQADPILQKAGADANPWVRAAAAQGWARNTERTTLEQHLGPLLADTNLHVAATAAVALLEPETRRAAGLENSLDSFSFETVQGGRSEGYSTAVERPLSALQTQPGFLASARQWLGKTNAPESIAFALLLAQYGDFVGIDQIASTQAAEMAWTDSAQESMIRELRASGFQSAVALLTGIGLSHDPRYVPVLRRMAAERHDEWGLRKVLQALRGMTGPDARQLRLEINKQMRKTGGASDGPLIE